MDGEECVDLGWFTPRRARTRTREGEILLVFPTIKHLEQLSGFATVESCSRMRAGARCSRSSRAS